MENLKNTIKDFLFNNDYIPIVLAYIIGVCVGLLIGMD